MNLQETVEHDLITKYRTALWSPFMRAVSDYELVKEGDKVAVCISGGKDSFLLAKCMQELAKSTEWRDREPVARLLSEVITEPSEEGTHLILELLFDDACAVRSAMISELPTLVQKFGNEWTEKELLTELKLRSLSDDYQIRQTVAIAIIDSHLDNFELGKTVLEALVKDPIANVRYMIAKRLPKDSLYLETLSHDEDPDVREVCE